MNEKRAHRQSFSKTKTTELISRNEIDLVKENTEKIK